MIGAAQENLDDGSFLPRLGSADKMIEKHLEAAKEGSSFLVIYAPDKLSSDRAMNVIQYRIGGDQLLVDAQGRSWISMEDYAIAFADELENPAHSRQRFTVGY